MKRKLSMLLVVLFAAGCSPSLFELASLEDADDYYRGREILRSEDANGVIFVSFEEQYDTYFVLYVEVVNKRNKPVTIDPSRISMRILESKSNNKPAGISYYALNPEVQLKTLRRDRESGKVMYALSQGVFGLIGLAEVMTDLDDENKDEAVYDAAKWTSVLETNGAVHQVEMDKIDEKEYHWQYEVLQKTTLYQDERIGGLIYIHFDEMAEILKITVPFGQKEHEFLFKQNKLN